MMSTAGTILHELFIGAFSINEHNKRNDIVDFRNYVLQKLPIILHRVCPIIENPANPCSCELHSFSYYYFFSKKKNFFLCSMIFDVDDAIMILSGIVEGTRLIPDILFESLMTSLKKIDSNDEANMRCGLSLITLFGDIQRESKLE